MVLYTKFFAKFSAPEKEDGLFRRKRLTNSLNS